MKKAQTVRISHKVLPQIKEYVGNYTYNGAVTSKDIVKFLSHIIKNIPINI